MKLKRILGSLPAVVLAAVSINVVFAEDETAVNNETVEIEEVVSLNTIGVDVTWTLDTDGVLTISGTGSIDDSYYGYNMWDEYINNAHGSQPLIKEVIIEEGVTRIGDYAFCDCSDLESVTIPSSVKSIGYRAFAYCYNLENVTMSEGVESIGDYAFEGTSLKNGITIPSSVKSIGYGAFMDTELYSITIPEGVESIGAHAFDSCFLANVTLPNSLTSIGDYAFTGNAFLTSITIPKSVTSIGEGIFYNCMLMETVYCYEGSTADDASLYPDGVTIVYLDDDSDVSELEVGDIRGDGTVDVEDVADLLECIITGKAPAISEITDDYMDYADVDGNGKIDTADAAHILQKILDSDYKYPIEG